MKPRTLASNRMLVIMCSTFVMLSAVPPVYAASKLIVIPTARTQRQGTQTVSLERASAFLNPDEDTDWSVKAKRGLNRRTEAGISIERDKEDDIRLRLNAKYAIPISRNGQTALAFGFQSLGVGSRWIPYTVGSRYFGKTDTHLGLFDSKDGKLGWFIGADYRLTERWLLMADYTNGSKDGWSAGFEYEVDRNWSLKAGAKVRPAEDDTEAVIEFKYTWPVTE